LWGVFIQFSLHYCTLCDALFPWANDPAGFIHRSLDAGGGDFEQRKLKRYKDALTLYLDAFKISPSKDFWPPLLSQQDDKKRINTDGRGERRRRREVKQRSRNHHLNKRRDQNEIEQIDAEEIFSLSRAPAYRSPVVGTPPRILLRALIGTPAHQLLKRRQRLYSTILVCSIPQPPNKRLQCKQLSDGYHSQSFIKRSGQKRGKGLWSHAAPFVRRLIASYMPSIKSTTGC